jgi:hypothetical protein
MEGIMGFAARLIETPEFVPDASVGPVPNLPPPLPEEGLRLIRDFLRIERPGLRERVFEFVADILRAQEEG